MGQEISSGYNQFVRTFNQSIQNQDISPTEKTQLDEKIASIKNPQLNQLAHTLVDQAQIQSNLGTTITPVALITDASMEIDMHFKAQDKAIVPIGSINLRQDMMQKLIEKLLKDSLNLSEVSFRYDPASTSYTMKGKYQMDYLPDPCFSLTLKPLVKDSSLVFQIKDLQYPGPHSETLANLVLSAGAGVLNDEGLTATFDKKNQSMAIDLNSVLHQVTPLPRTMDIDFSRVETSTTSSNQGNLSVVFSERGKAAPTGLDTTRMSDIQTSINTDALRTLLDTFLRPDIQVDKVSIQDGKLQLKAKAYSAELGMVTEGFGMLSSLMGGPYMQKMDRMPLTLTLEPRGGTRLYFASSIATDTVAETVKALGPKVEKDAKGEYFINFEEILQAEEGSIKSLRLTADGVELDSHINIDHFLNK